MGDKSSDICRPRFKNQEFLSTQGEESREIERGPELCGRFEIICRKMACILASMNGEPKVSAGAVLAAYAWVTYYANSIDVIVSSLEERFKMTRLEGHPQKILGALQELGGKGLVREIRRKAGLSGAEMGEATCFLLGKAPSPIAIEGEVRPKVNGATQDVAWVRLIE
jgi:hypothetical protein